MSLGRDTFKALVDLIRGQGVLAEHTHKLRDGGSIRTDFPVTVTNALQPPLITDSSMLVQNLNSEFWLGKKHYIQATAPVGSRVGDFWVDTSGGFQNFVLKFWDGTQWTVSNLDASQVTTGRFPQARMPTDAVGKFLVSQGVGVDPIFSDPDMNVVKVGGTAVTGRDISLDLKVLSDVKDADGPELTVLPKGKGKTTIIKSATAINANVNIYTVTAGKTFYLVYGTLAVQTRAANVDASGLFQADTAGDGVFRTIARIDVITPGVITDEMIGTLPITPSIPLPFAAATVFRINSGAANTEVAGNITGWEE